jgi:hypothetical protein
MANGLDAVLPADVGGGAVEVGLRARRQVHVAAFGRQRLGDRQPDPLRRVGHQRPPPAQIEVHHRSPAVAFSEHPLRS